MVEIASQITICLIIAAFIGFLIGYLVGKGNEEKGEYAQSSSASATSVKIKGNVYNKPEIRSRPRPSGKDDLKIIEGIDANIEKNLNELGVFHFDQISKWNDKNCEWVAEYCSLEYKEIIKDQRWVEQAQPLATQV